jgi:hypothetical protein
MGRRMIDIQRRSYCIPSKKEGKRSIKPNPFGLKAKQVTSLNSVKIRRKIKNKLITHKMVFGILY